jgi:2'-hydroxyisoflavone reductase
MDRRQFIQHALAASALTGLRLPDLHIPSPAPKTILILGGTSFVGPALVEAAVAAGHTVTLFNRGITNPGLFPQLEKLHGLRSPKTTEEDWSALGSRHWDAIVDVWPSDPALAESAATRLRDRTSHHLYVSSIAAYDPRGFASANLAEDAALNPWDLAIRPYDRGKAESERRLQSLVGGKLTVVRPGPIKGDRDDTPDLLAWLRRVQRGGTHIGPGAGDDHVQMVDVKDVARFLVQTLEHSWYGTFNLTGTAMAFREFVERCNAAMRSRADFVWIPRDFLHQQGLDPAPFNSPTVPSYLGKFPFWHPEPERRGFFQVSSQKAFALGWTQRPFADTAADYLRYFEPIGTTFTWTDELASDVEARVLQQWLKQRRRG